ncbi:MAG: hypothetical protein NTV22_11425 [bacterium]|nr:hypothetical protein [bacterium]
MDEEMKGLLQGSALVGEVRTLEPGWTAAVDAAKVLGVPDKRVYGWIYRKLIVGCKKEGGKLLVSPAEMSRLIGLRDEGTLAEVMSAGQRHGAARPVPAPKRTRKVVNPTYEYQMPVEMTKMVSLSADDMVQIIRHVRELGALLNPLGIELYPTVR